MVSMHKPAKIFIFGQQYTTFNSGLVNQIYIIGTNCYFTYCEYIITCLSHRTDD